MMRYIITALLIFAPSVLYSSQINSIIRGRITDISTREPLAGVYITYGRHLGTTSDENGFYSFTSDSGRLTIIFRILGYQTVKRDLIIRNSDTLDLNIEMEMKISEISQVVISAGKTEQKIAELTVSMDVVKTSFLTSNHITDAQEILNKTTGIEIMDGQASIRGGSGFSYGAGSRVMALIDGLPVLSADAGNIKWQFLPLENITQVEIIKGASSVLYGSSALNGIINFRQSDASNIPETHFLAEAGIYGKPSNNKWKWWNSPRILASSSFSHLQKYGNNSIGISGAFLYDNGYRKLNDEKLGRLSLRLKHSSKKITGLTWGMNINSGYTDKQDFVLWEDATYGALKQSRSTAMVLHGDFVAVDPYISFSKSDRFRHSLKTRLQSTRNRFPESPDNNSDAASFYSEYQTIYKSARNLNLTAGILENYGRITSEFYGDHTSLNLAGYAQADYTPFHRLKTVAGIRLEKYVLDQAGDKLVPVFRAGANYQVSDFTFFRLSFGQGYRYPSVAEKFASTSLGSVRIYPNPEVNPEKGWNTEIGIKQGLKFGKINGGADISAFLTRNSSMIEYIFSIYPDPVTGIPGYGFKASNVEQSRITGYEIEIFLNAPAGPLSNTINGGYTYISPLQYNENTHKSTGVYLKYRRKHSASINISSSWKKIELGLGFYAKSKILNIDDVFLNPATRESVLPGFYDYWTGHNKGYISMDGFAGFKMTDHLTISFMVKNLTNEEYMGRPGDIQPQRFFSLRISGNY